ncbi:MAG: hypothetical protein KDA24_06415 [Deltaproteobacteria bacterium]|nr:hypothetical protein [Deltaproteobacteria bacterium]
MSPLGWLLLAVAAIEGALWSLWGSPVPIYDEAGYLASGAAVGDWIRCSAADMSFCEGGASALGRILWHNPGYTALFAGADLLPGDAAQWLRGLQLLAGLACVAAVHRLVRPYASPRVALLAAALVGLHPTHLFFRLTLWPVAFAAAGTAAVLVLLVRVENAPSRGPQRTLGLAFVALTLVYPLALGALPLLFLWVVRRPRGSRRETARHVLLPAGLTWGALALVSTLALGGPALLLSGPENVALGNNPWIAPGRGSALHDKSAVQTLRNDVERQCPAGGSSLEGLRCATRAHRSIAARTIRDAPGAALRRALLRGVETWSPDDYVARHLRDDRIRVRSTHADAINFVVLVAEALTLLLAFSLILGVRPDRRVLGLAILLVLCTLPVLSGVGLTRLRQPLLPVIALGAALTWARYHSRR